MKFITEIRGKMIAILTNCYQIDKTAKNRRHIKISNPEGLHASKKRTSIKDATPAGVEQTLFDEMIL